MANNKVVLYDGTKQNTPDGPKQIEAADNGVFGDNCLPGNAVRSVALDQAVPGIPVILTHDIADATGDDGSITLPSGGSWRVINAWLSQKAAGNVGNTYTLEKTEGGSDTAITNAIAGVVGAHAVLPAGTIDDAAAVVNGGSILKWAIVKAGGDASAIGYTQLVRLS